MTETEWHQKPPNTSSNKQVMKTNYPCDVHSLIDEKTALKVTSRTSLELQLIKTITKKKLFKTEKIQFFDEKKITFQYFTLRCEYRLDWIIKKPSKL